MDDYFHTMIMDDTIVRRLVEEEEEKGFSKETQKEALTSLRSWLEENSDTMKCRSDDEFLHGFLRMRDYDVTKAKEMIEKFCDCCKAVPRFTSNLDVCDHKLNDLASSGIAYGSPFRDAHGRRIAIAQISNLDTASVNHVDMARYLFAHLFMVMDKPESQLVGFVYIVDFGNITPAHATFWPVWDIIHLVKFAVKAIPVRHKEIHVINLNPIIKFFFYMALGVVPSKMKKRVNIHNTLESLHKMVSPDVLPLEYGGSVPAAKMCELSKKYLQESRELIMSMQNLYG